MQLSIIKEWIEKLTENEFEEFFRWFAREKFISLD